MKVAGGSYLEVCLVPHWRRILGSGGRAALALSSACAGLEFFTYAGQRDADDIEQTMRAFNVKAHITRISENISFSYFHPLSTPYLSPRYPKKNRPIKVAGKNVLRFGFIEGDAVVKADCAVFDPQGDAPSRFEANGSFAKRVAYVLNVRELATLTGQDELSCGVKSLLRGRVSVVVVKKGASGVAVYTKTASRTLPVYKSDSVFKIGSGDIFSAVFALKWAHEGESPFVAADEASRAVADYVDTRALPIARNTDLPPRVALSTRKPGRIYLAGPFFDISKRWLIEESLRALEALGAEVFSPFHEVGMGGSASEIATKDLRGLRKCSAVLALLDGTDPGTIFEIGYARRNKIPVVVLAENVKDTDLTMLRGSKCDVVSDFATAIYRSVWASCAP